MQIIAFQQEKQKTPKTNKKTPKLFKCVIMGQGKNIQTRTQNYELSSI